MSGPDGAGSWVPQKSIQRPFQRSGRWIRSKAAAVVADSYVPAGSERTRLMASPWVMSLVTRGRSEATVGSASAPSTPWTGSSRVMYEATVPPEWARITTEPQPSARNAVAASAMTWRTLADCTGSRRST